MQFVSDAEWKQLLEEVEKFDLDDYLKRTEMMHSMPGYVAWWESRPKAVQDAFRALPFHKFYTDKATQQAVYRIYGVVELKDGGVNYHAVSAHLGWTNDVIGGISAESLLQIDKWSDEHMQKIRLNNAPQMFLLPSGWVQASMAH